jgi:hypothetical protein
MPDDVGFPILKLGLRHECIAMSLYESFGVPSGRPVTPIVTPNTSTRMLPRSRSSGWSTAKMGCAQIMEVSEHTDVRIRAVPEVSHFNARASVRVKPVGRCEVIAAAMCLPLRCFTACGRVDVRESRRARLLRGHWSTSDEAH